MNIIAPCPKKPTSMLQQDWNSSRHVHHQQHQDDMVDDACFELRQILQNQGHYRHYCTTTVTTNEVAAATTTRLDEPLIPRTNNPLPLDSSFVPLHQNPSVCPSVQHRPRSLSVGDSRPVMNLVH
ncbi:hypothetical protein [Absidia glauca]|uniref:Uncharacterized protein n=1 Tax=Absidia glauca TaxID=4829 RepID=A0A168NZC8_ABSGL|nr:hypothetical protein [Absidia glauca]